MSLFEISEIVTIGVGSFGIVGGIIGVYQYSQSRVEQRKKTVLKLADELDYKKEYTHAKLLLDDFFLNPEPTWDIQDRRHYGKKELPHILRDHDNESITDPGEVAIRESFDYLLGFFGKVWYLYNIKLIRGEELEFFKYYFDKAAKSPAVKAYVKIFPFPMYERLIPVMEENFPTLSEPKADDAKHHGASSDGAS